MYDAMAMALKMPPKIQISDVRKGPGHIAGGGKNAKQKPIKIIGRFETKAIIRRRYVGRRVRNR